MDEAANAQGRAASAAVGLPRFGLAGRVLLLIVAFVLLAEVAIYVPSIANFRNNWLRTRLSAAYTAALVLDAAPEGMVPQSLKVAILDSVGARMIVLKRPDSRRMLAVTDMPPEVDEVADLRDQSAWQAISAAFGTLTARPGRVLDVRGQAPMGAEYVEVALDEKPLKAAMGAYSLNILLLSLAISLIVALLAVAALSIMVLAPVRRLTGNVVAFAAAPEDDARIIAPSGARHEIGAAEEALADMERALARELSEKKRLAALGLAVAKINHDLRNMLTSAQLISDRMASASDPLVVRLAPKLVATLDRAIRFCQATLTYGRSADEKRPCCRRARPSTSATMRRRTSSSMLIASSSSARCSTCSATPSRPWTARAPRSVRRRSGSMRNAARARSRSWSPTMGRACRLPPATTCFRPSVARRGRAAPAWGSPSPPISCARMAGRSD